MKDFYRKNVIDFALIQLNKKYEWGEVGYEMFDCSGLTYYIFKTLFNVDINESGYGVGDTTKQMTNNIGNLRQYNENDPNKDKYIDDINVGDLIFFHRQSLDENMPTPTNRYPGHVGIYMGDKKFIHASSEDGKVVVSDLNDYWISVMIASRDIISGIIKLKTTEKNFQ